MKKTLICLIVMFFTFSLLACESKLAVEPEQPPQIPEEISETPEEIKAPEQTSEAFMTEINIYHLGIRTPLETNEEHALALARQFMTMLEKAAEMDSMEAPPESTLNSEQVRNGHTALELIYAQDIDLPLELDGEPITARRLLFYIPVSSSEGGLLFVGHDLYEEIPLGCLFEQSLQNSIYNNATDQVERITLAANANKVIINGQSYDYAIVEDTAELSGRLLNRILYRAMAFYLNAYTGNVNSLQAMSTGTLYEAVLKAQASFNTGNDRGEEIIANFNHYILADYFQPQLIFEPVRQGDNYQVVFQLSEQVSLAFDFVVEEDMPLVNALQLILPE